jgi:hypothetical protein
MSSEFTRLMGDMNLVQQRMDNLVNPPEPKRPVEEEIAYGKQRRKVVIGLVAAGGALAACSVGGEILPTTESPVVVPPKTPRPPEEEVVQVEKVEVVEKVQETEELPTPKPPEYLVGAQDTLPVRIDPDPGKAGMDAGYVEEVLRRKISGDISVQHVLKGDPVILDGKMYAGGIALGSYNIITGSEREVSVPLVANVLIGPNGTSVRPVVSSRSENTQVLLEYKTTPKVEGEVVNGYEDITLTPVAAGIIENCAGDSGGKCWGITTFDGEIVNPGQAEPLLNSRWTPDTQDTATLKAYTEWATSLWDVGSHAVLQEERNGLEEPLGMEVRSARRLYLYRNETDSNAGFPGKENSPLLIVAAAPESEGNPEIGAIGRRQVLLAYERETQEGGTLEVVPLVFVKPEEESVVSLWRGTTPDGMAVALKTEIFPAYMEGFGGVMHQRGGYRATSIQENGGEWRRLSDTGMFLPGEQEQPPVEKWYDNLTQAQMVEIVNSSFRLTQRGNVLPLNFDFEAYKPGGPATDYGFFGVPVSKSFDEDVAVRVPVDSELSTWDEVIYKVSILPVIIQNPVNGRYAVVEMVYGTAGMRTAYRESQGVYSPESSGEFQPIDKILEEVTINTQHRFGVRDVTKGELMEHMLRLFDDTTYTEEQRAIRQVNISFYLRYASETSDFFNDWTKGVAPSGVARIAGVIQTVVNKG